MFRPRIGQQLLMAIALGLFLFPAVSRATTVVIPKPFKSDTATPASLSVEHDITINNDGAAVPSTQYFGKLDVNNNAVVFSPAIQDDAHALSLYNKVNDMVRSGSDFGVYDGTGISSSLAGTDAAHGNNTMGIGVLLNDAEVIGDPGNALWGTAGDLGTNWMGYNPTRFDTLVMYTYLGDSFLRGIVDGLDTFQVFGSAGTSLLPTRNTWGFGDYFYQATSGSPISGLDTFAAFSSAAFVSNGTYPLTVSFGQPSALSVPEPGTIVLSLFGVVGLVCGSRRLRRK